MKMSNLEIAMQAIRSMELDDLPALLQAVKSRRELLSNIAKNGLAVGDMVSFIARRNVVVVGRVTKINVKNVIVRPNDGSQSWNVLAALLKPVQS
jgi:hypothetical protein